MNKALKIFLVVLILCGLAFYIPTNYYLIMPGSADELDRMVDIPGRPEQKKRGEFYLVTVSQQPANLLFLIYGLFHPHIDLQRRDNVLPHGMDPAEYRQLMKDWMRDSQLLAKVIALRRAGYEVPVKSDGVEVVEFASESPAQGIIQPGDIIKEVEGKQVFLAEELVSWVQQKEIGQKVNLTIEREGEIIELSVPTAPHTDNPDKAALRVFVRTINWEPLLPVEINIETGEITGPSAGMMFVLEILNQLLPEDLTAGEKIAGTGTVNINEVVGSVGGVKQKVIAAERKGATYFLVPQENFSEAQKAVNNIQLVPVENMNDVLEFLKSLQVKTSLVGALFLQNSSFNQNSAFGHCLFHFPVGTSSFAVCKNIFLV